MMTYFGQKAGEFVGNHPIIAGGLTAVGIFGTAVANQGFNYAANPELFVNQSKIFTQALGLNVAANSIIPVGMCLLLLVNRCCCNRAGFESIQQDETTYPPLVPSN